MKFTIQGRPPYPRNHAADHRSDYADEHSAQDVRGSASRVQQPGGEDLPGYERGPYGEYRPRALAMAPQGRAS
jgi:hypothetical protein